jgi:hypothetical protein
MKLQLIRNKLFNVIIDEMGLDEFANFILIWIDVCDRIRVQQW